MNDFLTQAIAMKALKNGGSGGAAGGNAEQIAKNKADIGLLKEDLADLKDKKITKFYASNQGKTHLADSDNGKIQDMMIYGKSSQDGTPSVENPVEIKSVVNPTIKLLGSNILKINDGERKNDGVTVTVNDGAVKLKGTANTNLSVNLTSNIAFKEGTEIIFSPNKVKGMEESNDVYLDLTNNTTKGFSIKNNNINTPYIIKKEDTKYLFNLSIRVSAGTNYDETWKPQILIGKTITAFKPYTEQAITLPITLNAMPVSSGGNVTIDGQQYIADYVDVERGKLVRMVDTLHPKLAGDMSAYAGVKEHVTNYRTSAEGADKKNILSNMLLWKSAIWSEDACGVNVAEYDKVDFSLPYEKLGINSSANARQREIAVKTWLENNDLMFMYVRRTSNEIDLTPEEVQAFKALVTYYPVTNISVNSEQLDGYTVFNYPISLANGWNYVKQQLNDNRDYIYDMDLQSAEAYVNSEYAVTLTELEV